MIKITKKSKTSIVKTLTGKGANLSLLQQPKKELNQIGKPKRIWP